MKSICCCQKNQFKIILAGITILAVVVISIFRHWEMTSESWGYWLFARFFAESGRFIVIERSPLYILYLNIFRWLGYPNSVTVEYIMTSCIAIIAIVALSKRYLGLGLSVFAALLWLPFMQVAEPPVQKLALACSCLAIVSRRAKSDRFHFALSYALFGLAYLFRHTYAIFIIVFAGWDVLQILRQGRMKALLLTFRPQIRDWPILIVIGLLAYFLTMQSEHRWNNAAMGTVTWFPNKCKSVTEGSFFIMCNWRYIYDKYGTFEGKDFYFTNQELFGGADTILGALRANPGFILKKIVFRNIKMFIPLAVNQTEFHKFYLKILHSGIFPKFSVGWLCVFTLIILFYGAFCATKDMTMNLFVLSNIINATVFCLPQDRYMFPLIPIFILSAYWYSHQLRSFLLARHILYSKGVKHLFSFVSCLVIPLTIIIFSNGITDWTQLLSNLYNDIRNKEIRVMEDENYSIKASFSKFNPLIYDCKGIMSSEYRFIGAFMKISLDKVYDIFEIPPFGHLGDSIYKGLSPDRIDCIVVSHLLANEIGHATNYQIRYQNYIKPYVENLKKTGANTYKINDFGEVVILSNPK